MLADFDLEVLSALDRVLDHPADDEYRARKGHPVNRVEYAYTGEAGAWRHFRVGPMCRARDVACELGERVTAQRVAGALVRMERRGFTVRGSAWQSEVWTVSVDGDELLRWVESGFVLAPDELEAA